MACLNRQQHILDRAERVPLATTWKADHVVIAGEPGSHGRDALPDALLRDPALHVSTPFLFYPANPRAVREMLVFSILSQTPKFGSSSSCSSSSSISLRRFLRRREPDCPATILSSQSDCQTSGFSRTKDDDEHEDESSTSEFRFIGCASPDRAGARPYRLQ
jgi:hypothetical protein